MGSTAGIPNTILAVVSLAFALYISQDKWLPKLRGRLF